MPTLPDGTIEIEHVWKKFRADRTVPKFYDQLKRFGHSMGSKGTKHNYRWVLRDVNAHVSPGGTLALIGVVLIQRSEGGGLGIGSSQGMGAFMGGRGTANLLTRTTAILAVLFFATCIGLNLLALHGRDESGASILDSVPLAPATGTPAKPALPAPLPAGPSVPKPQ